MTISEDGTLNLICPDCGDRITKTIDELEGLSGFQCPSCQAIFVSPVPDMAEAIINGVMEFKTVDSPSLPPNQVKHN